jgi:protein-tyrosine-phosphatase
MPSVCFVCLGNICRSPMAQAVMESLLVQRGRKLDWTVDSAGTGTWHVGKAPAPRPLAVLRRQQVPCDRHARQVRARDFTAFDHLLAMDEDNLAHLQSIAPPDATAALGLLGDYDPDGRSEVPDPYYGGADGFDQVFAQVMRCCTAFLDAVDRPA